MIKKSVIAVLLVFIVLIAGVLIYVNSNLNAIVKAALERYGSEITQTDVSISTVDISLSTGEGSVSGFHVGNPKSYFAARAIDVDSVSLKIDRSSVTKTDGPIIIEEVRVNKPEVVYEINAEGTGNLNTLQSNISSWSASKSCNGDEACLSKKKQSRNVVIKNLYINDGIVSVTHSLLGDREVTAALPPIHLKNIGQKNGATPEQVAGVVLGAIVKNASKSGAQVLKKELLSVKGVGDGVVKDTKDAVKSKIKGLF